MITTANDAWDYLECNGLASEETLRIVTTLNGHSLKTLEDVLFVTTGYRSFEQLEEADEY